MNPALETEFAPAERASDTEIQRQHATMVNTGCTGLVDAVPIILLVLNGYRQAVFANRALRTFLGLESVRDILGMRPGEIFSCEHAHASRNGCGTSRFCRYCGATKAILLSQRKVAARDHCSLNRRTRNGLESLELSVSAEPYDVAGESFTVFCIQDVGDEVRRVQLERIFFHDVLNTAGGLRGLLGYLLEKMPPEHRDIVQILRRGADKLLDEIKREDQLARAERGDLPLRLSRLRSREILDSLAAFHSGGPGAEDIPVDASPEACEVDFVSDRPLMERVVSNMIKNAQEATRRGGRVSIGCRLPDDEHIIFWVRNESVMPEKARYNVFKRSFTTKGNGRGLGTYSMRLLSEQYLGGHVSFESEEGKGTTFMVTLPLQGPPQPPEAEADGVEAGIEEA